MSASEPPDDVRVRDDGWWLASDGNWYPPWERPGHPWRTRRAASGGVLLVAAAAAAAAFVIDRGGVDSDPDGPPAAATASGEDLDDAAPLNEQPELLGGDYGRGDCVMWPIDADAVQVPEIVDCDEPHRIELAGSIVTSGDEFPSEDRRERITEEECRETYEAYFGGPIDPRGRVVPYSLIPTPEGWDGGDRKVWCGLRLLTGEAEDPYEGSVLGVDQELVYESGTCLVRGTAFPVPCEEPHTFEVTGSTRLADGIELPPEEDDDGWQALVGAECDRLGLEYVGDTLPPELWTGWINMEPESYAAGSRTIVCFVAHHDGTDFVSSTGSVLDG